MATLFAFLKGINVGGNRKVPMAQLREALAAAGYEDVRTLLASGNVVVETDESPAKARKGIERAIHDEFGFPVDVVIRTLPEIERIAAHDPFDGVATDGAKRVVAICDKAPSVTRLQGEDFGEERWHADGDELHCWCPDGLGRSPLMEAVGKAKLAPIATVRNRNTLEKLIALARQ